MITDFRKKHIFGVAELLLKYGKERGFSSLQCQELYTLGLVHDVGYAFLDEKDYKLHNHFGGELLKRQGYKFWKEVYYHGVANSPYQSEYLTLLNLADMHIDGKGNYVTFEKRLEDISKRHNVKVQELESYQVIQELKEKGFN